MEEESFLSVIVSSTSLSRPKTDYLFSGIEDTVNLEISKKKMDWMNNVNIFSQNSAVTDDLL